MAEGNGHSNKLPRSVNIHKEKEDEEIDPKKLHLLLESMMGAIASNAATNERIESKLDIMDAKIEPVVNFHRNMRVGMAISMLPFYFFIGADGKTWVKDILFPSLKS